MRLINVDFPKLRNLLAITVLSAALFGNAARVSAHGDEDHGEEKPKTATTTAGTISRTARLGDFEIMLKHALLEPDQASTGRLFITRFATNEAVGDANPAMEIESAAGAITEIAVEKTASAGSYTIKIPALTEGAYTLRAKTTAGSKTNTATFSGVEVAHHEETAETGMSSWTQSALIVLLFLAALAAFGSLAYFARRTFGNKPLGEETVSA